MADHLSDIVLRLVRNRKPVCTCNQESLFEALKSSLDEFPPDPLRIDASKRRLLLPPNTPFTRLFSPHEAIQQALTLADHRIRTCFLCPQDHLYSKVIHDLSIPSHLDFSAKRDLLELLLLAPPSSSSTSVLQDKLFGKIIDDACKQVVTSSASDCLEELVVSAIINATSDNDTIRSALVQRLLLSTAPRPLERSALTSTSRSSPALGEGYPGAGGGPSWSWGRAILQGRRRGRLSPPRRTDGPAAATTQEMR